MTAAESITAFLVRETEIIFTGRPVKITPDAPLASLGYDSMSFVELMIAVEKKYGIKLIDQGLTSEDTRSLTALAERIKSLV